MKTFSYSASDISADRLRRLHQRIRDTTVRSESNGLSERRSLSECAEAILSGEAASLNRMEWIRLCGGRQEWSFSDTESDQLAGAIWSYAADDSDVSRILLWRVALYHTGREQALREQLWDAFSDAPALNDAGTLLRALIDQKYRSLIRIAHTNGLTPGALFRMHHLPARPDLLQPVRRQVSAMFFELSNPSTADVEWYVRCLEKSSPELKVKAAEQLLGRLRDLDGSDKVYRPLRDWLRKTFNPSSKNDLWTKLSSESKRLLREWLGAATYKDFETIVDLVLERVRMEDWQENQLRKRRDFWKNYSTNYLRLRILLPDQSRRLIEDPLRHELGSDKDIGRLESDGSEASEVCIFDFGKWYIVEFFRGSASEMRLFEANQLLERLFFEGTVPISVKRVRAISSAKVFDHKYLWQPMCERWLQEHDIYVNEGLDQFLMDRETGWHQRYDLDRNLPYRQSDLADRERGLEKWRQKVNRLEREARRWIQRVALSEEEEELYARIT